MEISIILLNFQPQQRNRKVLGEQTAESVDSYSLCVDSVWNDDSLRLIFAIENSNTKHLLIKKFKIMKKLVFTLIGVVLMSVNSMAATNGRIYRTSPQKKVENLAEYLELDENQKEDVAGIFLVFDRQMISARRLRGERKAEKVSTIVKENLKQMREALTWAQYRKYLNVLNSTLANQHLQKYVNASTEA